MIINNWLLRTDREGQQSLPVMLLKESQAQRRKNICRLPGLAWTNFKSEHTGRVKMKYWRSGIKTENAGKNSVAVAASWREKQR